MSEPIAARAFRDAVSAGAINVVSGLEPVGKLGDLTFAFELPVPHPNSEGLPAQVTVRATIPQQFPLSGVRFVPIDPGISGFPHQDGQSRALCLKPDSSYPRVPLDRLLAYIVSAREWFAGAATGQLLKRGDAWELPDFRTERKIDFPELFFVESARSFAAWESRLGEWGEVQLVEHVHGRGIAPVRFSHRSGAPFVPAISSDFRNDNRSILGTWILLPSLIVQRHRAARTFRELDTSCAAIGINVWPCLSRARSRRSYRGHHVVLIGAPIPRKVGDEPSDVDGPPDPQISAPHLVTPGASAGGREVRQRDARR
ncbi:hypothetical protein [Sorangium sp. So ce1000]|uniref:hypothetical protein n=1 Tax=Sorangium sp. So ce1000 TaxID=3133325 RepID=UPI003F62A1D5